jgi:hypothetical protein
LPEVSHILGSKGIVVVGPSFADHQETRPGGDLEALRQSGTAGLDNPSMAHKTEGQAFHGFEVLRGGGLVIEVQEEDLLGLFQLLEGMRIHILNAGANANCLVRV